MRIQRIRLQNFGCHKQLDLSFAPGLNIIKGPNGAGKSTLQRALLKLLFDKPSKNISNEKDRAWDSERLYTIILDFEVEGGGEGQLGKDFESNRCYLRWQSGEEYTTFMTVDSELKRVMNIPSDKLFTSTVFVAQEELTAPSAGKEITTSLEERVTSGHAGITTQKAVDKLAKEIERYGKGYGTGSRATTKPGLIAEAEKERERLEDQILHLRQRLTQFLQFQNQYQQTDQLLTTVQSELSSKRAFASQIDKVERLRKQISSQTAIEQQLDDQLEAINKAQKELEAVEQALLQIGPVSQLETSQHQSLNQLYSQVRILQNQTMPAPPAPYQPKPVTPPPATPPFTPLPKPAATPPATPPFVSLPTPPPMPRPLPTIPRQPIGAFILLGVGLLGVLAGVLLFALPQAGPVLALVTLLLGLISLLGGAGWWMHQRSAQQNALLQAQQQAELYAQQQAQQQALYRAQQLAQQQAQQQAELYARQQAELYAQQQAQQEELYRAQQLAEQQAELFAQQQAEQYATMLKEHEQAKAKAQSDLQQALTAIHCTSWQEFINKQADTAQEKARKNTAQAELAALLAQGNGRSELQEKRKIASRARRDAEEELESPILQPALRVTAFAYQELLHNIEQLVERNATLQRSYHELNGRLAAETISPTELIEAEEKLEALTQKIAQYKELLAVYQRTHELLVKAREQTIQRVRQNLESSTSCHFARLTHEKFGAVAIDQELKMRVTVPGLVERSVEPQELSCGTQDQLYFAMRLALIDNLWTESTPPLFLDDPFVTFDPERRRAATQVCSNLATTRQIFLFTSSDEYDAYGNVLALQPADLFVFSS